MMKAYIHDNHKFSANLSDNFEKNLKNFHGRYEQCGIVDETTREFSLLPTGVVLEYYFNNVKNIVSEFDASVSKTRLRFITEERTLSITQEWTVLRYYVI